MIYVAKKTEARFKALGLEVIDWQADDPSVGIINGWVIWRYKGSELMYELAWSDAIYCETLKDVLRQSERFLDD